MKINAKPMKNDGFGRKANRMAALREQMRDKSRDKNKYIDLLKNNSRTEHSVHWLWKILRADKVLKKETH